MDGVIIFEAESGPGSAHVSNNSAPLERNSNGDRNTVEDVHGAAADGNDDDDDDDDNALMLALLREAAQDPDQPSLSHWLIFGFSSDAVEAAYQAGHASRRALGIVWMAILWPIFRILFTVLGNAAPAGPQDAVYQSIQLLCVVLIGVPFTVKVVPVWKPVKFRNLLSKTCDAFVCVTIAVIIFANMPKQSRVCSDLTRADVMAATWWANMVPVYGALLLRPSPWLISTLCTVNAVRMGHLAYCANAFDSVGSTIVFCICLNMGLHVLIVLLESAYRVSFVHQLGAVTTAVAAAQARSEQEKATAKLFEQQRAYQRIVASTAHDLRTASSALQSGCRVLSALQASSAQKGRDDAIQDSNNNEITVTLTRTLIGG